MPAQSYIEWPLNGGIDTLSDEKFVQPPQCPDLKNAIFTRDRTVRVRDGYTALDDRQLDETSVPSLTRLSARQSELLAFSQDKLFTYADASSRWVERDSLFNMTVEGDVISDNPNTQSSPVCAGNGTILVTAWYDQTDTSVKANVVDYTTKAVITPDFTLSASAEKPLVCNTGSHVVVSFVDTGSNSITLYSFSASDPAGTEKTLNLSDLHSDNVYDMVWDPHTPYIVVGWKTTDANDQLKFAFRTAAGDEHPTYATLAVDVPSEGGNDVDNFISMAPKYHNSAGAEELVWVMYGGTATVQYFELVTGVMSTFSIYDLDPDRAAVRGVWADHGGDQSSSARMRAYLEDSSQVIRVVDTGFTGNLASGSATQFVTGVSLYAKAFRYEDPDISASQPIDNKYLLPVTYDSTLQSTLLLLDSNAEAVARFYPGRNNGHWADGVLGNVYMNSNVIQLPVSVTQRVDVADSQVEGFTQPGVHVLTIDFDGDPQDIESSESTLIGGGALWQYDGARIVENGFWFFPEVDLTQFGGTTPDNQPYTVDTGLGSDDVTIYVVYEWYDRSGRRHQSLALPFLIQNNNTTRESVDVPTLPFSTKEDVRIALYRSHPDDVDGFAYRVSSYPAETAAQGTTSTVTVPNTVLDSALKAGEILDQTKGILPTQAPLPATVMTTHDDRVFYVNPSDRTEIRFSMRTTPTYGPRFLDAFNVRVPNDGGDITALASLDQYLVIFKRDRIYLLGGEGPVPTGAGAYPVPQLLSSDTGCKNVNSIVRAPQGVFFQSDKGIYALFANRQLSYIGAPVEAYNDLTITAASLLADDNAVIFLTNGSRSLYFDYEAGAWSTFTEHAGLDAVVVDQDYYYLRSDDATKVYKKDTNGTDDGSAIVLEYTSPWYRPEGSQQLWRCYQMNLLGTYLADHDLEMDVYVNYQEYPLYTKTWDVSSGINDTTFGDGAEFGDNFLFGIGSSGRLDRVYQVEHSPGVQKVQSIKFVWRVYSTGTKPVELSSLGLDLKTYRGSFRLPEGKKV